MSIEKKSIFDLVENFRGQNWESPLGDWKDKPLLASLNNVTTNGKSTDFLPVVNINYNFNGINCIIPPKDCTENKTNITLSKDYDEKLRNYSIAEITLAKTLKSYIPVKNELGYDPLGFQDEDGKLEFICSNKSAKIKIIDSKNPQKIANEKMPNEYHLNDAEIGDEYIIELDCSSLNRGDKFKIDIYATDDSDGWFGTKSKKKVKCGQINFIIVKKDVFLNEELQKGINELNIISLKHKKRPTTGEYSVNYCIQAADRFLGSIVENKTEFYAYDDKNNKLVYAPSLPSAPERAKKLKQMGYIKNISELNGEKLYSITEKNELDEYDNNPTRILKLITKDILFKFFKSQIGNDIGLHVYYLSIVDALHTLFIVINNTDPSKPSYTIYDEDGPSSSLGDLKDIDDGILRQSLWVYLWTKKHKDIWPKLNILLAKFQRK